MGAGASSIHIHVVGYHPQFKPQCTHSKDISVIISSFAVFFFSALLVRWSAKNVHVRLLHSFSFQKLSLVGSGIPGNHLSELHSLTSLTLKDVDVGDSGNLLPQDVKIRVSHNPICCPQLHTNLYTYLFDTFTNFTIG